MHPDNPALQAQLDRVLGNLNDDSERLVYADMLTEIGDARGEFIVLQLLPKPSKKQEQWIARLVKKHGIAFAGPLDKVLYRNNRSFTRGFLSRCSIKCNVTRRGDIEALETLVGHAMWATMERFDLPYSSKLILEIVCNVPNLRELEMWGTSISNLNPLRSLANLRYLGLSETSLDDLSPLCGLKRLEVLSLEDAVVPESEVAMLQKAQPNLSIRQ